MRVAAARELGHQAQQVLLLLCGQLIPELPNCNGVDPPTQCFEHLRDRAQMINSIYQACVKQSSPLHVQCLRPDQRCCRQAPSGCHFVCVHNGKTMQHID